MMKTRHFSQTVRRTFRLSILLLVLLTPFWQPSLAATPGLPFTEDFSDSALQDLALTNAN